MNLIFPTMSHLTLHALETGTVIMEVKDGQYEPVRSEDILY